MNKCKIYFKTAYLSPVGKLTLASDGEKLMGLWIEGQKYFSAASCGKMSEKAVLPVFRRTKKWLDLYFKGEQPAIGLLPLAPQGNAFRQAVWKILCKIPYGQVITYGQIARQMARRLGRAHMSAQAIGGAVGHNPIAIIIPCHRVVGANGNLTGYAGGLDVKIKLLRHEGANMTDLFLPKNKEQERV